MLMVMLMTFTFIHGDKNDSKSFLMQVIYAT